MSPSLADYCAVALSDAFLGDGEILAGQQGWVIAVAVASSTNLQKRKSADRESGSRPTSQSLD